MGNTHIYKKEYRNIISFGNGDEQFYFRVMNGKFHFEANGIDMSKRMSIFWKINKISENVVLFTEKE